MISMPHRARRALAVTGLALLAAACILAPGKFSAQLDLKKNRDFSFRYTGEIVMVPLMKTEKDEAFEPSSCFKEDSFDERPCTDSEIAEQKAGWAQQREERRKSDAQATQMMLGGIDPNDPKSGEQIAARLRRQAGWKKVDYLGDGKFDVDFAISGQLDHDFTFPTFEGFPMANAFVQVFARADGSVRVDAPGFGPPGGGAAAGMMSGLAQGMKGDSDGPTQLADGGFTIVTDGEILANNTDEGAPPASGGRALFWKIDPRTAAAPTALVKLAH